MWPSNATLIKLSGPCNNYVLYTDVVLFCFSYLQRTVTNLLQILVTAYRRLLQCIQYRLLYVRHHTHSTYCIHISLCCHCNYGWYCNIQSKKKCRSKIPFIATHLISCNKSPINKCGRNLHVLVWLASRHCKCCSCCCCVFTAGQRLGVLIFRGVKTSEFTSANTAKLMQYKEMLALFLYSYEMLKWQKKRKNWPKKVTPKKFLPFLI